MVYTSIAEIFDIGWPELILVLAILLLIFGGKKLPELAHSIGQSAKELRKSMNEGLGDEPAKKAESGKTDQQA